MFGLEAIARAVISAGYNTRPLHTGQLGWQSAISQCTQIPLILQRPQIRQGILDLRRIVVNE